MKVACLSEEIIDRLVCMTVQTNLVSLEKALCAIGRAPNSYLEASVRVGSIAERLLNAVHQIGKTLDK